MAEHYPRNVISAPATCPKCKMVTAHRVDQGRIGPCLECLGDIDDFLLERRERAEAKAKKPVQSAFWPPPAA